MDEKEKRAKVIAEARALPLADGMVHRWRFAQYSNGFRIAPAETWPEEDPERLAMLSDRIAVMKKRCGQWGSESWEAFNTDRDRGANSDDPESAYRAWKRRALRAFEVDFPEFERRSFEVMLERGVFVMR